MFRAVLVGAAVLTAACAGGREEAPARRQPDSASGAAAASAPPCSAPGAVIALDHVVVAVRDLDGAAADYRAAGFTLKPGRLHANGLLNAHAKLRDSTEIELMSLAGPPADGMARGYAAFLEGGEGGAYLALRGERDLVLEAARRAGLEARVSGGTYVGFDGLPRIFALEGFPPAADPDSLFVHANGAAAMREVWIEGGEPLERLLVAAGAAACGPAAPPAGAGADSGRGFALARGRVVVLAPRDPSRPVVRGVVLDAPAGAGAAVPAHHARGMWIAFREAERGAGR